MYTIYIIQQVMMNNILGNHKKVRQMINLNHNI